LNRLAFRIRADLPTIFGTTLIAYSLFIYPFLGMALGHRYPYAPAFGIAPCPTTIFTFGILLWADRRVPWYLLLVPLLWSLIGLSAAFNFGVWQDVGLGVAGIVGSILIVARNRRLRRVGL
jgi:hypothetical protein